MEPEYCTIGSVMAPCCEQSYPVSCIINIMRLSVPVCTAFLRNNDQVGFGVVASLDSPACNVQARTALPYQPNHAWPSIGNDDRLFQMSMLLLTQM